MPFPIFAAIGAGLTAASTGKGLHEKKGAKGASSDPNPIVAHGYNPATGIGQGVRDIRQNLSSQYLGVQPSVIPDKATLYARQFSKQNFPRDLASSPALNLRQLGRA